MYRCLLALVFSIVAHGIDQCLKENGCDVDRPNVILIVADDLGFGDLASFGHPTQEYNAIDEMARFGLRFQQFYAADSMCSPARAALLTGRLPVRTGMTGGRRVFVDYDTGGLPKREWTLAEMFQKAGYSTGMAGKWHLGINEAKSTDGAHLPDKHGFEYVGWNLPYTHEWECDDLKIFNKNPDHTKCFLYYGSKLMLQPYRSKELIDRLDESFNEFIDSKVLDEKKPFFYYYSFPHVHSSAWPTEKTDRPSRRGLFGDSLNEMAWGVQRVLDKLKKKDLENSMVIFTSDHGPHREICTAGGTTNMLKGGKSNAFEGGFKVPTIVYWPGVVPKGVVSSAVLSHLDILPSLAMIIGEKDQKNLYSKTKIMDGIDASDYLIGKKLNDDDEELTVKRPIFFYCNRKLMAVRYKHYKVHYRMTKIWNLNTEPQCPGGWPMEDYFAAQICTDREVEELDAPLIYDLNVDPHEQWELSLDDHVTLLHELERIIEKHEDQLDMDDIVEQMGHFNATVIPCCNYPKCECDLTI